MHICTLGLCIFKILCYYFFKEKYIMIKNNYLNQIHGCMNIGQSDFEFINFNTRCNCLDRSDGCSSQVQSSRGKKG